MSENTGRYPGGKARAKERWEILTRHVRPVALQCLRSGHQGEAWSFYRSTFAWHLSLRTIKVSVRISVCRPLSSSAGTGYRAGRGVVMLGDDLSTA